MGCDIHAHIEYKELGDRYWHWCAFHFGRNYLLFALMANVRNDFADGQVVFVAAPRGVPNDASYETISARKKLGSDGHSHSWLTLEEMCEVERRFKAIAGYGFPVTVSAAIAAMEALRGAPPFENDVRLVFWFDN